MQPLRVVSVNAPPLADYYEKDQSYRGIAADMFMPLSYTPARAEKGLFTKPFYDSYYALLALSKNNIIISNLNELSGYNVGVVGSVALEPLLRVITKF